MTPATDRIREQRFSHLQFAKGAHGAFVVVEAKAGWVPIEAAKVNQAPRFVLKVRNQGFVAQFKKSLLRQNLAPMRHQRFIAPVVTRQLPKIVREIQSAFEKFGITGKAGVARIALQVDDPRLRQGLCDQSEVAEIGWQLVGNAQRLRGEFAQFRLIGAAQRVRLSHRHCLRIRRKSGGNQISHPAAFATAKDIRMARQNLLHKAGAGARHANNKNCHFGWVGADLYYLLSRKTRGQVIEKSLNTRFVIGKARAIKPVSFRQMGIGRFIGPQIIISFEQGEVQLNTLGVDKGRLFPRQSFEHIEARIAGLIAMEFPQGSVEGRRIRGQADRMTKASLRVAQTSQLLQHATSRGVCIGITWIKRQRAIASTQGFTLQSQFCQRLRASEPGRNVFGGSRQGGIEILERSFAFTKHEFRHTQLTQCFSILRREGERFLERFNGFLRQAQSQARSSQCGPGVGEIGAYGKRGFRFGHGLSGFSKAQQEQAEMLADQGVPLRRLGRHAQRLLRLADAPALNHQETQAMKGAGVMGRHCQHIAIKSLGFHEPPLPVKLAGLEEKLRVRWHGVSEMAGRLLSYRGLWPVRQKNQAFLFSPLRGADKVQREATRKLLMPVFSRLTAGAFAGLLMISYSEAAPLPLIPMPAQLERGEGAFVLSPETKVVCAQDGDASCTATLSCFSTLLRQTPPPNAAPQGTITFQKEAGMAAEAYHLHVEPSGVVVSATSDAGLFYGAVTLWQLASQDGRIPTIDITDGPRFSWRGVMLDSVRHFQPLPAVKKLIDAMAVHKLNVLQWHLTDDQGWRLEIKKYPRLTKKAAWRSNSRERHYGGFYTQSEAREIVAYAAARHITVVPEIEMPGHASAAIVAYPKLASIKHPPRRVSGDWGIFPNLYNADDATFAFLEDVLTEVMAVFPSPYIHVGGDEAPKGQWNASPRITQRLAELNVKDTKALQGYFTTRIGKFLASRGRRLIGWDEILEGEPPASATVMSWRSVESAGEAAAKGHDVVLSPAPQLYLDNCQLVRHGEPTCRGAEISLHDIYAFDPQPKEPLTGHLLGMQANIWTEHLPTPDAVFYAAFPRLAAFSEIAWSPVAGHDWQNFLQRVPAQMARYKALGIPYADAAFSVSISAAKATSGAVVSLSNQTGLGTIRYTRDGSTPTASSPAYGGAFEVPLPATITAMAFQHGEPLAAASQETITAASLLKRNSYTLEQCSKEILLAQKGKSGAIVMVNIMNPCWIYRGLDLSSLKGFDISVTHMPFNFQIGDDVKKIPLDPKSARHGQLEIRLDDCKGETLAILPLKSKTTHLKAKIKALAGVHDVCFVFARRKVDPIWAIDWVQPLAKE